MNGKLFQDPYSAILSFLRVSPPMFSRVYSQRRLHGFAVLAIYIYFIIGMQKNEVGQGNTHKMVFL